MQKKKKHETKAINRPSTHLSVHSKAREQLADRIHRLDGGNDTNRRTRRSLKKELPLGSSSSSVFPALLHEERARIRRLSSNEVKQSKQGVIITTAKSPSHNLSMFVYFEETAVLSLLRKRTSDENSTETILGTVTLVENPQILPPVVAVDVEKAVTFFSKNPQPRTGPSLQASLDRLSIDVMPELTPEVLKRLGNAASLAVSFFGWSDKRPGFSTPRRYIQADLVSG